jgi:alpha-beta hydrolase superfamily lysophospholipase
MLFLCMVHPSPGQFNVERHDLFVESDPGIRLFVREAFLRKPGDGHTGRPLLLLPGARVPGLASLDLSVPGGSFAADLVELGFDVYVTDIRGYGSSTKPKKVDQPRSSHAPLVRSNEALETSPQWWISSDSAAISRVSLYLAGQPVDSGPATTRASILRKLVL